HIPDLVQIFFRKSRERNKRPELAMSPALLPYFVHYRWPGNVRELENIVERIVVLARGRDITVEDLPQFLRLERAGVDALEIDLPSQGVSLEAIEKELILRALHKCDWNQTRTARYLDLSGETLIYRLGEHKNWKPTARSG